MCFTSYHPDASKLGSEICAPPPATSRAETSLHPFSNFVKLGESFFIRRAESLPPPSATLANPITTARFPKTDSPPRFIRTALLVLIKAVRESHSIWSENSQTAAHLGTAARPAKLGRNQADTTTAACTTVEERP